MVDIEEDLGRVFGFAGWTALYALSEDGADRVVHQLVGYVGGEGTPPTEHIGEYLKGDGTFTSVKSEAANIKGGKGFKGWSPKFVSEADGSDRMVLKLAEYIGGEGDAPTENVGLYLKDDGTYTSVKADAANYKGNQGNPGISTNNMTEQFRLLGMDGGTVPGTPKQLELIGGYLEAGKAAIGFVNGSAGSTHRRLLNPIGGGLRTQSSGNVGAIQIKVPATATNTTCYIKGTIKRYVANATGTLLAEFLISYITNSSSSGAKAILLSDGNMNLSVRWTHDGTDRYIYLGELTDTFNNTDISIDEIVISGSAATLNLITTPIAIQLQPTAFIGTINHTQTETRPAFNPNQILSEFALGANTAVTNLDSLIVAIGKLQTQINARLTEAQADALYLPRFLGNTTNAGIYIETSYLASTTRRIFYRIEKRGATSSELTFIEGQFQMNSTGSLSASHANVMGDTSLSISIFRNAGGFICLWIPTTGTNGTVLAYVCATADAKNIITNITNVAKPSGITDEVIVTPRRTLLDNGSNANLILGDGSYGASPFYFRKSLNSTDNLNDFIQNGSFVQIGNANATLALNYPITQSGELLVFGSETTRVAQMYVVYNTASTYVRSYSGSGTWSAWKRFSFTDEVLSLTGGTLTGDLILPSATPPNALSAAPKQYVENSVNNAIAGLKFKTDVRVASTGNVNIASAPSSIDGVTLTAGNRILLKDQTDKKQNGIYVFNGTGNALTRATDADTGAKLASKTIPVTEGTINADAWFTIIEDSITIGTTEINFTKVGGEGNYSSGDQISIVGNTINVVQDATHRFVTDTEKTAWNGKATVLSNTTTISSTDATAVLYKDVTVTGATVGMCVFVSDPLLYNSSLGKYYRLYPRVISANTVRVYIQSFHFEAGTSDAEFYDTTFATDLQNLNTGNKTITIKVI